MDRVLALSFGVCMSWLAHAKRDPAIRLREPQAAINGQPPSGDAVVAIRDLIYAVFRIALILACFAVLQRDLFRRDCRVHLDGNATFALGDKCPRRGAGNCALVSASKSIAEAKRVAYDRIGRRPQRDDDIGGHEDG